MIKLLQSNVERGVKITNNLCFLSLKEYENKTGADIAAWHGRHVAAGSHLGYSILVQLTTKGTEVAAADAPVFGPLPSTWDT